ncbi:TetR/AcrR family transcriptional regulator [Rhizobiales bacterium]|uniref:TetR/AcrR family transcriptional regulator n=1 Tax=Hongsoonwoonella zoysiae TaxID=2821844 RepID=UPI00156057B4|nr:TetR/AcrR family transcriptional regulator [Hongsoonwoonella zoysiae]NRG19627.1 TetR/AcrR family transcriptional regulator [Hongsoonwoonella zoysiae]
MARHREFDEEKALAGALEVFWQRGYSAAGMQELCAAMGLNPGSVYGAYGNKHDLFIAAMRRYLEDVTREGIDRIAAAPTGREGIRSYFDYLTEGIVSGRRQWGCLGTNAFMEMADRDDTVQTIMKEHFDKLEVAFREALERDRADLPCRLEPVDFARYLVCVAQGLNVLSKTAPDRQKLNGIVDAAMLPVTALEEDCVR